MINEQHLAQQPSASSTNGVLRAIATYHLVEAALMYILTFGVLRLMNQNISTVTLRWIHELHLDPNLSFIHAILNRVTGINKRTLAETGIGTGVYAVLRTVEGVGLWLNQRWAKYLTIIATGILLPVEIYEMAHHFTLLRLAIFAVNLALVIYLARHVLREA